MTARFDRCRRGQAKRSHCTLSLQESGRDCQLLHVGRGKDARNRTPGMASEEQFRNGAGEALAGEFALLPARGEGACEAGLADLVYS